MPYILYCALLLTFTFLLINPTQAAEHLKRNNTVAEILVRQDSSIHGRVLDEHGKPLPGVNVKIKELDRTAYTDQNGIFYINNVSGTTTTVIFSHVGHRRQEIPGKREMGDVKLVQDQNSIEEVVVSTGMFTRKVSSLTGATATFQGEDLRRVGNINVIESLRSLDPSFILLDNNALGSDPNQAYQIQVRGQSSLTTTGIQDQFSNDPNQPLFVLDGMETTINQIVNLDITRVASVTILKDAATTALYGSRAANGVIVVETIRPTPGRLQVSYSANAVLEMPDLRSYNMMNAAEFLEFQRLSGYYERRRNINPFVNDLLYNSRLQEVNRGVNSYWLNTPVQSTFNVRHSLNVAGGDDAFTYNIGGGYRNDQGVMIGSNNRVADGNITFSYRKGKINITNLFMINGVESNHSPYGSFSDYVAIPPYYRKTDEYGNLNTNRYLEQYNINLSSDLNSSSLMNVPNPLYNASLNSRDRTNTQYLSNNLNALWDILPSLRFNAGFQASKTTSTVQNYVPSENTIFDNVTILERGSYDVTQRNSSNYQGFAGLIYNKVLAEKHSINGNLRANVQETRNNFMTTQMVGFPAGVEPVPNFSVSYAPNASASGYEQVNRNVSFISSINYSFENKYNIDATFNFDGANSFGSENLYAPFWALGASWNLHNEAFLQLPLWVDQLRLRGNYGYNGNQSLGQFTSTSTYIFHNNVGSFGQGMVISSLGNAGLAWQQTGQLSVGLDATLLDRRLTITLNGYEKITNPLIGAVSVPTSTGVETYFQNVGGLRSLGFEYNVQGQLIRNKNTLFSLGFFGSVLKNSYFGLSNRLDQFNEANRESNSLQRFSDGNSPDDIWAVRSLGIDPATGSEVFLTADGQYTTQWNANDEVIIGNIRPLAEGVINANLSYKGIRLTAFLRYQLQQSALNTALYQRVENITNLDANQDRRALYGRWQNIGDVVPFRSIQNTDATPISSRFVQRESILSGESISAGYDFTQDRNPWIKKLKLSSLRSAVTANNIFRLSNLQAERGLDYPFARTVTFTLNAFF